MELAFAVKKPKGSSSIDSHLIDSLELCGSLRARDPACPVSVVGTCPDFFAVLDPVRVHKKESSPTKVIHCLSVTHLKQTHRLHLSSMSHPQTTDTRQSRKRQAETGPDDQQVASKRARTETTTTTTEATSTALPADVVARLEVLSKMMRYMGVEEAAQLMPRVALRAHDLAQKGLHFGQLSIDRKPYQLRVEQEGPNALIAYVVDSFELGVPFVSMGFSFMMKKFADHLTSYNIEAFTKRSEQVLENAALRSRWWKLAVWALHQDAVKKGITFTADAAGWRAFHDRLERCWHHKGLAKYKVATEGNWSRTFFKDSFEDSVWLSVQKFWHVPEEDPAQAHLDAVKQNNSRRLWEIDLDEVPVEQLSTATTETHAAVGTNSNVTSSRTNGNTAASTATIA